MSNWTTFIQVCTERGELSLNCHKKGGSRKWVIVVSKKKKVFFTQPARAVDRFLKMMIIGGSDKFNGCTFLVGEDPFYYSISSGGVWEISMFVDSENGGTEKYKDMNSAVIELTDWITQSLMGQI